MIPIDRNEVELEFGEDGDEPEFMYYYHESERGRQKVWLMDEGDSRMADRVGLDFERATQLEDHINEKINEDLSLSEYRDVASVLEDELDDDIKWLDREIQEDDDYERDSFWSSKHNSCPRKRYYKWMQAEKTEPNSIRRMMTLEVGSAAGIAWVKLAARAGILDEHERYFRRDVPGLDYPRSGYADIVIEDPTADGAKIPVEVKSSSSGGFETFEGYNGKKYHGVEDVPRKGHILQLYDYMLDHYGGWEEITEDDYGYLFYTNKDSGEKRIYRVYFNWELFNEGVYNDMMLQWFLEAGEVPPRHPEAEMDYYSQGGKDGGPGDPNPNNGSFPCIWNGGCCDFLSRCWKNKAAAKGNEEQLDKLRELEDEEIDEETLEEIMEELEG